MHLLHYPLPTASILNPSYCFLPLPCGTFHLWLLSFLFCLTVDYATGEPLFQISTKYSISSDVADTFKPNPAEIALHVYNYGQTYHLLYSSCFSSEVKV